MKRPERSALREYELSEQDAEKALEALLVLAEGMRGANVQISIEDKPQHPPVSVPRSAVLPMIDLLGLLISKGTGKLLVIDGNEEVSLSEAATFIGSYKKRVKQMITQGDLASRMDGDVYRIRLDSLLPHFAEPGEPSA